MRQYELISILRSAENAGKLKEIIKRHASEIVKEDDWGTRRLQFKQAELDSGHYLLHVCKIAPEKVKELSRELQIDQDVISYMVKRVA